MPKETVIVFGAHNDDFVIGAGGTIAKYKKKKVISIIFSYGENSHPWMKPKVIKASREKEAIAAARLLGCETIFFDLRELKFKDGFPTIKDELLAILKKEKPTKIFTHSQEDPHPDHKAVHAITQEILPALLWRPEVYIYSVWNPVSFKTDYPLLYEDISPHFWQKLKALNVFTSQRVHVAYPTVLLLFRAVRDGFKIRKRFAERFFRIQ